MVDIAVKCVPPATLRCLSCLVLPCVSTSASRSDKETVPTCSRTNVDCGRLSVAEVLDSYACSVAKVLDSLSPSVAEEFDSASCSEVEEFGCPAGPECETYIR